MIHHKIKKHSGKVLIHCSAGIGRTGVLIVNFLLVHYFKDLFVLNELITSLEIQFLTSEVPCISVFGTTRKIREQRWGVIANDTQYEFIYSFMEYWIAAYIFANEN